MAKTKVKPRASSTTGERWATRTKVAPIDSVAPAATEIQSSPLLPRTPHKRAKLQLAAALFDAFLWLFMAYLVLLQFASVFWGTTNNILRVNIGQSPLDGGPALIAGLNDEPLSDRAIVCVLQGRTYAPVTVNDAIKLSGTKIVDTTGAAVNGYRVVKRTTMVLSPDAKAAYTRTCAVVTSTLDSIFNRCTVLGYNVTRDKLRVMDDLESSTMYQIDNSLPVLIIPYWDNAFSARFVVPGWDGSACMMRLTGKYTDPKSSTPYAIAISRTNRETKTVAWLQRPGGRWRNGWYEDLQGAKWFADFISDEKDSKLGIPLSQYNMDTGDTVVCMSIKDNCYAVLLESWASKFTSSTVVVSRTSIIVANGKRFGFFQYKANMLNEVKTVYDWETLLSNVIALQVLFRWMLVMIALHRGYSRGVSDWFHAGVGCLADSYSFTFLPILMLPRLKVALFAFWTSGMFVEGPQRALSEAWFFMYPAIFEVVLLYYSLLNLLAKLVCRRVSDVLFGPTLLFFCALHYLREDLSTSGWLEISRPPTTLVSPAQFTSASLFDFFTTDLALRTNAKVKSIFVAKLIVLGASLLPLVWSIIRQRHIDRKSPASNIEKTLAIRIDNLHGLGRWYGSAIGSDRDTNKDRRNTVLNSYEVARLGFIVFGDSSSKTGEYLITFEDWDLLTLVTPMRKFTHLWNHRIVAFALRTQQVGGSAVIADEPEMMHVDDERLQQIRWWRISSRSVE